jgi:predicted transcriptional regulator
MIDLLAPGSLESAREAAGLSRIELAAKSGVHETTIFRIEKGIVDPKLRGTWAPIVRALLVHAASLVHAAPPRAAACSQSAAATSVSADARSPLS